VGTMLKVLLLAAAAALAGCQTCEYGPTAHASTDQPMGARCRGTAECAAGLTCLEDVCTVDCAGAPKACPAGATCIFGRLCLPTCAANDDCLMGSTVGICVGPFAPEAAYCFTAPCDTDDQCPPQGRCAGASRAHGLTWNDTCSTGWCQR